MLAVVAVVALATVPVTLAPAMDKATLAVLARATGAVIVPTILAALTDEAKLATLA